uniref:Uncharacterized protein n=1 Tax=Arundo donax TaxID=35708 RepID=A0A0A9ERP7_ARUDO
MFCEACKFQCFCSPVRII